MYGVALLVFANVPLVLVTGHTRVYLLILAATLSITGAVGATYAGLTREHRRLPRAALVGALIWSMVVATANWQHTNTFAPCAPDTRRRNAEAMTWDIVSADVRGRIAAGLAACGAQEPSR